LTGFFSYLLVGGFNIHTPHHLFPTADLSALPKILAIIDEVCKEKGIRQTKNNRLSCFVSLSKNIVKRSPFSKK
jgi:fatty acid desaturase